MWTFVLVKDDQDDIRMKSHGLRACQDREDCCLVVFVCLLIVSISSATMCDNYVEEGAAEALQKVAEGNVHFTTSLYKAVSSKDGNVLISPVSVELVLALAYMGAAGSTAEQIASALHLPLDREDVKTGFAALLGSLKSSEDMTLEIANKVFSQINYSILPEYRAVAEKFFLSGAQELDFADGEGSRKVINSWVESKTNNKIKDLIPSGVLNDLTRLVLVNAVYFKGLWHSPFSAANTVPNEFHLSSRESKMVPMMCKTDDFGYLTSQELDADILEMPYKDQKVSMFIILPHDVDGISKLEEKLASENLTKVLLRLPKRKVRVSVPKFKLEETTDLKNILKELGMTSMFLPLEADFSGISGHTDLYVSKVMQKAFIDVNEEGSEAAAATAAVLMLRCAQLPLKEFTANHPFVFVIKNVQIGVVLFAGRFSYV
ncbi:Leukocyte elastase inhibitor A [Cryptotermes secundus]|uniref:Leukocyte elastase inhibitor A n=2 Tax=Cryptotermes secundus TaxID=105785 RepID=A0A2J7R812_9NEOP|nr:serpin B6 isoform X3 [Cryptotermes secundus]PNF36971.1 Leukocyte elastase inhibitor A [Cryptotermes secundus]PNF36976.1 Leukocyte elastase inhibitor A [Cryptotermes secundus]